MEAMERVEMLLDSGIDVTIFGRGDESCERAGTQRWFVEVENYPVCVSAEGEDLEATIVLATDAYFHLRVAQ